MHDFLLKYWPLIIACILFIVWLVRIEQKQQNQKKMCETMRNGCEKLNTLNFQHGADEFAELKSSNAELRREIKEELRSMRSELIAAIASIASAKKKDGE